MKNSTLLLLLLCICSGVFSQTKELTVKTDVSEVTVFLNGAQVVRKKTIDLSPGVQLVKFTDLSPYLDTKSVQVRAGENVIVLAVNHQFNYTDSLLRSKEMESLNNKLKLLQDKLNAENAALEIVGEELNFLRENRNIGGKNQELSLNNFKETSVFFGERMTSLKMKEISLRKNIEKLTEDKALLEKQRIQAGAVKPVPVGEVLVKLNAKLQTKCQLELSYYVNNAGWYPAYDIRSGSISDPLDLIYKANIHQNTKEEWKQVRLKLSSTNPKSGGVAPQLQPYFLNYNVLPPHYSEINNQVSGRVIDVETNEPLPGASIVVKGSTIATVTDANGDYSIAIPDSKSQLNVSYIGYQTQTIFPSDAVMNVFMQPSVQQLNEVVTRAYGTQMPVMADALQGKVAGLDLRIRGTSGIKNKSEALPVEQTENMTSFEFEIKTPYTVVSDNKNTTVDIENYSLPAGYEYHCVPKVDKDAFLVAQLVNYDQYNLLEGEAAIFFENTFVGKSVLDVRNTSDTLKISLGRDKAVSVTREKLKEMTTKQFLGSKKEESRHWQINVKNNKKQAVTLKLYDQIPVSSNDEIEVITDNLSGGLFNKETGEVKWVLKLEPGEKRELQLKYRVKYPKEKFLNIE